MKTIVSVLAIIGLMFSPTLVTNASELDNYDKEDNPIIDSIGLIETKLLDCSVGTKKVHIRMGTYGSYTMDEIGFKNIFIQRSSDLVNWYTEKTISSLITTNQSQYYLSDYTVSVNGGYYYRINLDHYAKDGSTTEYQNDISYSVWIS